MLLSCVKVSCWRGIILQIPRTILDQGYWYLSWQQIYDKIQKLTMLLMGYDVFLKLFAIDEQVLAYCSDLISAMTYAFSKYDDKNPSSLD